MTTTLLEIDFQPWIIDLGHDAGVVDRAVRLRHAARARGLPVVCSRYLSLDPTDVWRADPDGPGARFAPGLVPEAGDHVITKHGQDVFDAPQTEAVLSHLHTSALVIAGVATDHGVRLAARSALLRGLAVTVVADACAGTSYDAHHEALETMARPGADIACVGACSNP